MWLSTPVTDLRMCVSECQRYACVYVHLRGWDLFAAAVQYIFCNYCHTDSFYVLSFIRGFLVSGPQKWKHLLLSLFRFQNVRIVVMQMLMGSGLKQKATNNNK